MNNTFDSFEAFYVLDNSFNVLYANKAMCELHNKNPEELIGKNILTDFPQTSFITFIHQSFKSNQPFDGEFFSEKMQLWFDVQIFPTAKGLSLYLKKSKMQKR